MRSEHTPPHYDTGVSPRVHTPCAVSVLPLKHFFRLACHPFDGVIVSLPVSEWSDSDRVPVRAHRLEADDVGVMQS